MVDSSDDKVDGIGAKRGDDMLDAEWNAYKEVAYGRTLAKFHKNDKKRQAEKRKFFEEKCPDVDDVADSFWGGEDDEEGDETQLQTGWAELQTAEKKQLMQCIKDYHGKNIVVEEKKE